MKILEIIPSLQAGGAEVFLVNLCNEMCRHNGVSVTLLTFYDSEYSFLRKKLDSSITFAYLPKSRGLDFKLMYRICDFIKDGGYDIAHFHVNAIADVERLVAGIDGGARVAFLVGVVPV